MKKLLLTTSVLAISAISLATSAHTQQSSRSFYDSRGHFSGSASTHGNNTALRDRSGHFSGSVIRNNDGSTSLYNSRGHFVGSTRRSKP